MPSPSHDSIAKARRSRVPGHRRRSAEPDPTLRARVDQPQPLGSGYYPDRAGCVDDRFDPLSIKSGAREELHRVSQSPGYQAQATPGSHRAHSFCAGRWRVPSTDRQRHAGHNSRRYRGRYGHVRDQSRLDHHRRQARSRAQAGARSVQFFLEQGVRAA